MEIRLTGLQFHGFHGLYEEEKKLGGDFEVNLSVRFEPVSLAVIDISETIDYSVLYQLVKEVMSIPTPLIETLIIMMAKRIFETFEVAREAEIAVSKLNPPIIAFQGNATVSVRINRTDLTGI